MTGNERRVALVSGGSRGIGRAAVLRLVGDGFDAAFCYHADSEAAAQVEQEAEKLGGRAVGRRVDVTDPAAVRAWVAEVERDLGAIHVVVTSAGIVRDGPLVMMRDDDWQQVLDTNLTGTYHVCRAAVFAMLKRRTGCVVTISSVAGVSGNASQTNYSAAKAGIIGFSAALAKEVGRYGIRVNVVAPGFIETDMLAGLPDKALAKALEAVRLGRVGTVEDVAGAVAYLVGAGYVTGTTLRVDGGLVL